MSHLGETDRERAGEGRREGPGPVAPNTAQRETKQHRKLEEVSFKIKVHSTPE